MCFALCWFNAMPILNKPRSSESRGWIDFNTSVGAEEKEIAKKGVGENWSALIASFSFTWVGERLALPLLPPFISYFSDSMSERVCMFFYYPQTKEVVCVRKKFSRGKNREERWLDFIVCAVALVVRARSNCIFPLLWGITEGRKNVPCLRYSCRRENVWMNQILSIRKRNRTTNGLFIRH